MNEDNAFSVKVNIWTTWTHAYSDPQHPVSIFVPEKKMKKKKVDGLKQWKNTSSSSLVSQKVDTNCDSVNMKIENYLSHFTLQDF